MTKISRLFFLIAISIIILIGCSNHKNKLIGTWEGSDSSVLVLNEDNTAVLDGGKATTKAKWSIKGDYLYIDRESSEYADLKAKIPKGDFQSITVEIDDEKSSSGWRTEIFTKK